MKSILHIDRSEFFQNVIESICQPLNYDYRKAATRKEALEKILERKPDLILSALELDDGSGSDFIREIKEGPLGDIPVVVITASDSLEIRKEIFSLGIADYILKTLPREQLVRSIQETITPSRSRGGEQEMISNLRIAVLDDSRFEREVIRSILEMNEFSNVSLFESPAELLTQDQDFDLYLIDMVLPEMTGEQVIRKLKDMGKKGMIIAVSGVDESRAVSHVLLSGADDYITKPFDSTIFSARLRATGRTFLLVQELEKKNLELRRLAVTDGLTGLYNRRHIYNMMERSFSIDGETCGVILFDLDHFKQVNDNYGHPMGDRVLKKTAMVIKKLALQNDGKPGRNGGEEFIVFFPGQGMKKTADVAEEIRRQVSRLEFPEGLRISVSGGVTCRFKSDTTGEFLYRADKALYQAKNKGRNQIVIDCNENG